MLRDPRTGRERTVQLGSPNRLNIIFDTNMRTSRAAGQWERIERTSDVAPILEYNLGASQRHREEHQDLEFTRRPIDDPFWNTHFPPNGYRCKCHVIQLTESKAKTRGEAGKGARSALSPPPKINFVQRRNPRTGRTERTPDDVDPGFAFNPGKVARPV